MIRGPVEERAGEDEATQSHTQISPDPSPPVRFAAIINTTATTVPRKTAATVFIFKRTKSLQPLHIYYPRANALALFFHYKSLKLWTRKFVHVD